jgi:hypothetical protein
MGWVVNPTPWLFDPWERYAVPILQETEWTLGPVRTGAKNLAPKGIRSRIVQLVASRRTDRTIPAQSGKDENKNECVVA